MRRIGWVWALVALAGTAAADTGDTGDTAEPRERDTAPYVDTGAVAEEVYVEDVGCATGAAGPAAGSMGLAALSLCAAAAWGRGARRRGWGPARSR